jgi:hypothetical protein
MLVLWHLCAPTKAGARAAAQTFVALDYEIDIATGGDCPDVEEFRASVERQLGYDPFRPDAGKRVAVQINPKEPGLRGRIRWSDAGGHWAGDRRLSSGRSDCGGIAASLAFSVAVQIQLMAALAPAPAEASAVPSAPPEPAPTRAASPAPETTATTIAPRQPELGPPPPTMTAAARRPGSGPRPRRLTLSVGLGPSIGLGVAPQTTGLGRLFVRGRAGWFSLELAGDAALPVTRSDPTGAGFSLDRFAASAAACGHARVFAGCVTSTVGRLQAHGFGVDQSAAPAGIFTQVGARILATHDVGGRYFASVRVDGLLMISRSTVALNDTTAWVTPRLGALFGLDFGAHFF